MLEDGRVFAAVAMAAVLFFLVERALPAESRWRRPLRLAAGGAVALGMAAALALGLVSLSGGRP
ncbi:MAG: hypothetical protein IT561_10470 [Alphaproteobacteria bacterium]|nr:hypothetical protein [Alphaproteobacteria bacterium]